MSGTLRATFHFGPFELDRVTGELRKGGLRVQRIQAQPLQLLLLLLEKPGEVVTREELRQQIWSADTFVDFDHALNTAINKLRGALGDSAASSIYIETLPRIGYRFIAAVERNNGGAESGRREDIPVLAASHRPWGRSEGLRAKFLSDPQELPSASRRLTHLLFSLIQIMYLGFYIAALTNLSQTELQLRKLTSYALPVLAIVVLTAAAGIPVRLYLISAVAFRYRMLARKFRRIFPGVFVLDEIWALAPLLLAQFIGVGLALCAVAALLYLPFAERSLLLMGSRSETLTRSERA